MALDNQQILNFEPQNKSNFNISADELINYQKQIINDYRNDYELHYTNNYKRA